jgi:glycine/D-amino acid oxidase-like deaminating enzyme
MPAIQASIDTVTLPQRIGKLTPQTEVLVVGGGPAGIGAALGAAAAGAKVVLAERYGFLGGNATAGLVLTWASYYTSKPQPTVLLNDEVTLFPADHGAGEPIIAGVLAKIVERLVTDGGALPPSPKTGYMVPFDPEILKLLVLEMLDSAGVELLFHAFASGVIEKDNTRGVVFETKSGPIVVRAKIIVDCTGDGDIAALAGAPYEVGRLEDGTVQPMTLMFLMEGFQKRNFEEYATKYPDQWCGVQGLKELMREATEKGELDVPRENILLFGSIHEGHVNVNSTRILNRYGVDVWDLTKAEIEGRRQIMQLTAFFRKYVPGFEKAYIAQIATNVSVRETRRIIGEYKLTAKDVLDAHSFSDVIALGAYPVDLHNPLGRGTLLKRIKPGRAYDIPLRCLIPLKVENMLVAGRCISGTHMANASYRTMPICFATGQAAGVCAAIACKINKTPRNVPAVEVQEELIRQGAKLKIGNQKNGG